MALNKSKGNMYQWVTHTWNVVKGKCPHDCDYCYMKVYKQPDLHFDTKAANDVLGSDKVIFVGSSCDMWAENIPGVWIESVLLQCAKYPHNTYLFQSKNPARFKEFKGVFPEHFILGTTIETNRFSYISKAPSPLQRYEAMKQYQPPIRKMISIEPIMNFDVDQMVEFIRDINPEFISIGADSKNHHLEEPEPEKIKALLNILRVTTTIKIKNNLNRLTE